MLLVPGAENIHFRAGLEHDHAVGAAEFKVRDQVALFDGVALLHVKLDARDLTHADGEYGDVAERIVLDGDARVLVSATLLLLEFGEEEEGPV